MIPLPERMADLPGKRRDGVWPRVYRPTRKQRLLAIGSGVVLIVMGLGFLGWAIFDGSAAPPPRSHQRIVGAVVLAAGGAGLVAGAVTGGLAVAKKGDLKMACTGNVCPESAAGTLHDFRTFGLVSTVMFIAGGVAAGAGLAVILTAPGGKSAEVRLGPGSVGLVGRF